MRRGRRDDEAQAAVRRADHHGHRRGGEHAPLFVETLKKYREEVKADPSVRFVRTPRARTLLEDQCRQAGITADAFQFTGDYYSLPNLVPLLSRPSKLDLLMEILEYPLPVRKPA